MTQDYWKLRALSLQIDLLRVRLQHQMKAAGLDPEKAYRFNDDTETIEVIDGDVHRNG